jgi:hypothetical protein
MIYVSCTRRAHHTYCCTLLLYSAKAGWTSVRKISLNWVELRGLEPLTPCLQSRCSSS